jgi:hypothetical protein
MKSLSTLITEAFVVPEITAAEIASTVAGMNASSASTVQNLFDKNFTNFATYEDAYSSMMRASLGNRKLTLALAAYAWDKSRGITQKNIQEYNKFAHGVKSEFRKD